MRVDWHGQSAFTLSAPEAKVFIDPFGDMSALATKRGMQFDYPTIEVEGVDLLLVTHDHLDHNAVEVIGGEPATLRSTAGRHQSPVGEVLGIASEHDDEAGTVRGPNTIFVFSLGGVRVAHFGDFGQGELRPQQRAAIGAVDLLFVPVGGGPTIGGSAAARIATELDPDWVVPMHYRTPRISFLNSEEEFVAAIGARSRVAATGFDTGALDRGEGPLAVIPAAP